MQRLLMVLVCLGALDAKMHIPLRPKGVGPPPVTTTADRPAPVTQLLENIKAKGVQAFVGEVSIGTPPQLMPVTFDTASDVSNFISVSCEDVVCTSRQRYNASASTTYEADGRPFEVPHGQNISGELSRDSIGLAGVTIEGHTFGEINAVWSRWSVNLPQAGAVGLGPGGSAPEGVTPLLDIMVAQGLIPERKFGIWLGRDPAGGELTLGGINEELYSGEMTWVNLTQPAGRRWAAPAQDISFEGRPELNMCASGNCSVVPISSTPYFLMSMANAKAVNDALGGIDMGQPGAVGLDCTTLFQLPTARIDIGGRTMEMSPLEYTFLLRFGNGLQLCVSGFVGMPHLDDQILMLGTLFMQKFYTAYDGENSRLGFADSK